MITQSQIDQYNNEGYTIVENVFNQDELNPILKEFDEIVEDFANKAFEAGKITNKHSDKDVFKRLAALEKDFKGSSVLIHHRGELKPALANLWGSKKLLDMVENWVGKDISGHPVWNIRSKTPQTARMTVPWHQDSAYLKEGAEKTTQPAAWIPFLDVNKNNGCMQVVSGGHKPERVLNHPDLQDRDIPTTGTGSNAAMGATETVFMYASMASDGTNMLYFVDKVSGEQLGGVEMEDRTDYGLMNYVHKGKQYIILQTGPKLTAMALYDEDAESGDDY